MMRVAKRPLWPAVQRGVPADRLDGGDLQRFMLIQRWQQARQAAGQQGFASTWRPGEKQVVRPGSGQ